MNISDILTLSCTAIEAEASSKKQVIKRISQLVCEHHTNLDRQDLFDELSARERLGSTAIGQGIAIPHCRLPGTTEAIGALITLESPIDFEAEDDQKVDIIFALVVPTEATQAHLNILATLARRFENEEFCHALRCCNHQEKLYQLMIQPTS